MGARKGWPARPALDTIQEPDADEDNVGGGKQENREAGRKKDVLEILSI